MVALGKLAQEALDRALQSQHQTQSRSQRRFWSDVEVQQLRDRYADDDTAIIAADLGRSVLQIYSKAAELGLNKSQAYIAEHLVRSGQQRAEAGRATRFKQGLAPWNKGRKGLPSGGRSKETQFGKGHMPHNWVPVGTEQVRDGYRYRKVTDTRTRHDWKPVHIILWEQVNGPIPAGHCLCFKDGNREHIEVSNLELITRSEHMQRNTIQRYPPALKDAIRAIGKLKRTIRKAEHEK